MDFPNIFVRHQFLTMKRIIAFILFLLSAQFVPAQPKLDVAMVERLSRLPIECIPTEFPNKTSHLADSEVDARLLPRELHPVFYGCLDWHSSLHGHWMLVRLLKEFPQMSNKDEIVSLLDNSFQPDKMQQEAEYFGKYTSSKNYERTYGWAWLLKLDEELLTWKGPSAQKWHAALQPLTQKILTLWKDYLPRQTYPSRVGTHTNTAFGLAFALDWARAAGDTAFASAVADKARYFYLLETNTPAWLEPDGADFFSPSLEIADLMRRVLSPNEFTGWLEGFYTQKSIDRLCEKPFVSDRTDYHIVHLDGLYFSRAWCMKGIAASLPEGHRLKKLFADQSRKYIEEALPHVTSGGYGGEHWLASFAIYSLLD